MAQHRLKWLKESQLVEPPAHSETLMLLGTKEVWSESLGLYSVVQFQNGLKGFKAMFEGLAIDEKRSLKAAKAECLKHYRKHVERVVQGKLF